MPDTYSGKCLCGAVTLTVTPKNIHFDACHCSMCRRWAGGPLLAVECEADAVFEGKDSIRVYDSSEWAQRGFCKACGTHLYYRLKGDGHFAVPIGLLDDSVPWEFTTQIFVDQQPNYYEFANETKHMTGAEVFAAFAPEQ